jgi:MSHA biogenesis protein MshM
MYREFFGLTEAPFKLTPNTDFFFAGGGRGEILCALIYAVTHGEGMVKVAGEVGSGKTMLLRMLQEGLPGTVESIYIPHPSLKPEEMLQAIARELALPPSEHADRLQAMNALQAYLIRRFEEGKRVVLLLEEAQAIPLETLEEVRLLTNIETPRDKLLQIVLFGQPELDTILSRPDMRQFRERISHTFDLMPLKPSEIRDYLGHRLEKAGYRGPPLFSPKVLRALAAASSGIARRLNILADKTLLAAFTENTHAIRARHVLLAARDNGYAPRRDWPWAPATAGILALCFGAWLIFSGSAETMSHPSKKEIPVTSAIAPRNVEVTRIPEPAAPASLLDDRAAATLKWLETAGSRTASIQIMTAANTQEAESFLQQAGYRPDWGPVYIYPMEIEGRPRDILLFGAYADRAEALGELNKLPSALARHRPLVRTVGGIKKDLGKAVKG